MIDYASPLRQAYFVIPGDPIPLARARFGNNKVWDSQKQIKFGFGAQLQTQFIGHDQFKGPVRLDIDFYFKPAQSISEKKKLEKYGQWHAIKPDISNLIKFVEDVATGILFHDDCLIATLSASKHYDDNARTEITIIELE